MDLSTPQRLNKRRRDKTSPSDENKCAKFRANVETGEDDDDEGNEDIFNNEAMEYPADSSSSLGAPKNEPSENEQNLFFS